MSTILGSILFLFLEMISPDVLNILSDATEVACMHKYGTATLNRSG